LLHHQQQQASTSKRGKAMSEVSAKATLCKKTLENSFRYRFIGKLKDNHGDDKAKLFSLLAWNFVSFS